MLKQKPRFRVFCRIFRKRSKKVKLEDVYQRSVVYLFLLIVASRREQQLNGICRLPELKKPGKNFLFD